MTESTLSLFIRIKYGTQDKAAAHLQVAQSYVSNAIRGESKAREGVLRKIEQVDNIPASFFEKLESEINILLEAKNKEIVELRSKVIEAQKATVVANEGYIRLQKQERARHGNRS